MEQIVQILSARLGVPEPAVRAGIGILLRLIKQKAAGTQFEQFLALLPGAKEVLDTAPAADSGGFLGGLLEAAGGLLGSRAGEAAKAVAAVEKAGVPADKALPLAQGFFEQARQAAGGPVVDQLLDSVPGLKDLLGRHPTEGPQDA